MSEGRLARSGTTVVVTPKIEHSTQGIDNTPEIPIDVLRYFSLDFSADEKTLAQLKEISQWAYRDVETAGDGLLKLKHLEMRLGVPHSGESRTDKIHRWIKIQRQIDEMRKKQEALR